MGLFRYVVLRLIFGHEVAQRARHDDELEAALGAPSDDVHDTADKGDGHECDSRGARRC